MSEVAATPVPAADGGGVLQNLLDLFVSPGEAFRRIVSAPRVLVPLALAIALGLAFSAVWMAKVDPHEFIKVQIEESGRAGDIPADRKAEIIETQVKVFTVIGWISPLVFTPIFYALLAALFLFVYRFFYGGDVTFRQSMAVTVWSFLAVAIVQLPLMLIVYALKGDWNINPQEILQASPAALLDKATTPKPLYALAGSLDLFSAWVMVLLSIGFGAAVRKPASSAAIGILVLWAIYVMGKAALAAVF